MSDRTTPSGLPIYRYSPLDYSTKETRLAELLAGTDDDDLRIKIHSTNLNSLENVASERAGLRVEDLEKGLPTDAWTVRETLNGRFIFEKKRSYGPHEAYETSFIHPVAGFEPVTNNYNLIHTKPEYEALSHVWGLKEDETFVYVEPLQPHAPRTPSTCGSKVDSDFRSTRSDAMRKRTIEVETEEPPSKRSKTMSENSTLFTSPESLTSGDDSAVNFSEQHFGTSILAIQSDLAIALRHLRFVNRSRMLWIDNICINQKDTTERSHLVRHMGQIYKLANKVIVWLGPEHDSSDIAMSKLRYLGRQVEITNKGSWRVNAPRCLKPTWSRTSVPLPYDAETWEAIRLLLQRPWFTRLWVWQEAKLSNDESILQCGKQTMELYRFGAAVWCAGAKTASTPQDLQIPLFRAGDAVLRQLEEPFLNTLLHLMNKDCSDPRDKIYGALGLAPHQVSANVVPDYDKDVAEVYTEAAVALLQATDRVDFLLACDLGERTLTGPTWAPDWSVKQKRTPRWVLSTTIASGLSAAEAEVDHAPKPTLLVQGVEWGTISSVGVRAPATSEHRDELEQAIRSWFSNVCPEGPMYANEIDTLFDAFVKTMHWNALRERCPLDNGIPTLSHARETMQNVLNTVDDETKACPPTSEGYILSYAAALDSTFFRLDNGYIGMTSSVPEETDVVCIILGCPLPMILRPHSAGRYQVVGPAYMHGLMDAEALLGSLGTHLVVEVGISSGWHGGCTFRDLITKETLPEDPRLGRVPPSWVRTEAVRKPADPLHFCRFRNLSTGKTINGDPRLLPEALRERGVPLKPLKLV